MHSMAHNAPSMIKRNRPGKCRTIGAALALLLGCLSVQAIGAVDRATMENEVKAAYIYNFVKFVDWPEGTFSSSGAPIIIGIAGDDEFGTLLGTVVKNKTIQDHPIRINLIKKPADFRNCQLLFVSASELKKSQKILEELRGSPVITVTETDSGSPAKGMINIFIEGDKLQFEIDSERAEKSSLQFSSKLLRLSRGALAARAGKGE